MTTQPYYDEHGNQYDPNVQYASQYDPNALYDSQYNQHSTYASQYDPHALEYAGNRYEDSDPFAADYNDQSEYDQLADLYGQPEIPFDSPYDELDEPSAAALTSPTRASNLEGPEYYVSLEPCGKGSSCSMYDSVEPKCMIRLVGKGYQKDIELSLDSKMDSLVYRIFRCLEDEGICLDGVRLQGLPKKSCLKNCLAAICAPFTALCSAPLTKPVCCQTLPHSCCCEPSTCPKRSLGISPRRSTMSARYSLASQTSGYSTHSRRRRPIRRRSSNYLRPSNYHKPPHCRRPCRMAKVCQGPGKEDCVLIKISPSLPKLGGVKCKKRSTGVGTDDFPELEILLQGGKKKRCAAKNKRKLCVCPHCCSGGKVKVVKCRSRGKQQKETRNEKPRERPGREEWPQHQEEEWPPLYEPEPEPPIKSVDQMTEEELSDLLEKLEKEDNRFSFRQQPPPPRSSVNFVLVESRANSFLKSKFIESESHIGVPKNVGVSTDPLKSASEILESIEYRAPLKVYSVHQRARNVDQIVQKNFSSSKKRKNKSDPETAPLMREILHLANEILKNQNEKNATESPKLFGQGEITSKTILAKNEVNNIFHRSDLWISESDVDSKIVPTSGTKPFPNSRIRPRNYSSKSINFVARLKKSFRRKTSHEKSLKIKPESECRCRNHENPSIRFEKLKIYLETDKKDEPAEFVPIELKKKEASVCLNTLIR